MKTAVVFTDAHSSPHSSLSRFDALGRFILDKKPDAVACLGDLGNCDSVSSYPVAYENTTTLKEDADTMIEAQQRLWAPTEKHNKKRRKSRHKRYTPLRLLAKGNHEERLDRAIMEQDAGVGSVINPNSLFRFDQYWDQIAEYKEYIEYQDILMTHCPTNTMGNPITGVTRGRSICFQTIQNILYGHTHSFDVTTLGLVGNQNRVVTALNLPCFMDKGHVEEYATGSTTKWTYGFIVLKIPEPGDFSFELVSMDELYANYS